MMNDKDLQRKMKEQQIKKLMNEILDSYEDELPQMDEKMAKKIKMAKKFAEEKENELKLEKDSRSEKSRVNKAFMHIGDNDSVAGILGFALLKNGDGIFTYHFDKEFKVNVDSALSMTLNLGYKAECHDVDDDDEFEDFICGIIEDARRVRKELTKGGQE